MDIKVIELYCKYIIKPLEERKNKLEREVMNAKFWNRSSKEEELNQLQELLNEKLVRLSELMNEVDGDL
ncbi:MAG: hypothetical protein HFG40_03500 [Bacilli bacterium]|nr:hypothetical protein [Bacilli bacterium]